MARLRKTTPDSIFFSLPLFSSFLRQIKPIRSYTTEIIKFMAKSKIDFSNLNLTDLEKLTGFERRTIAKKLDEANVTFQEGTQNQKLYKTQDVLPILYRNAATSEDATAADLEKEKLLLTTAKRKKAELEYSERNREVIPIEEVVEIVGKEYSIIRAQFRSMPSKLAKHLAVTSNPEEIYNMLSKNIDEILSELQTDAVREESELQDDLNE